MLLIGIITLWNKYDSSRACTAVQSHYARGSLSCAARIYAMCSGNTESRVVKDAWIGKLTVLYSSISISSKSISYVLTSFLNILLPHKLPKLHLHYQQLVIVSFLHSQIGLVVFFTCELCFKYTTFWLWSIKFASNLKKHSISFLRISKYIWIDFLKNVFLLDNWAQCSCI